MMALTKPATPSDLIHTSLLAQRTGVDPEVSAQRTEWRSPQFKI